MPQTNQEGSREKEDMPVDLKDVKHTTSTLTHALATGIHNTADTLNSTAHTLNATAQTGVNAIATGIHNTAHTASTGVTALATGIHSTAQTLNTTAATGFQLLKNKVAPEDGTNHLFQCFDFSRAIYPRSGTKKKLEVKRRKIPLHSAAIKLQSIVRGHFMRKKVTSQRHSMLDFWGSRFI